MNNSAVLHIDLITHFYKMDVAPNYGIEPNTALVAHTHLAHNSGVFSDKTIVSYFWGFSPHGFDNHSDVF
jgi:hypothetical protein